MIVEQLTLANFRGFEQIDLKFENDVIVIAGVNGVGKSGILQALTKAFSRVLSEMTKSKVKTIPFTDDDIQHGKTFLDVTAVFSTGIYTWNTSVHKNRRLDDEKRQSLLSELGFIRHGMNSLENYDGYKAREQMLLDMLKEESDFYQTSLAKTLLPRGVEVTNTPKSEKAILSVSLPLVIYFSPKRQLPSRPRAIPEPRPFEPETAFNSALEDREVELREFMHWFRSVEYFAKQEGHDKRSRVLSSLRKIITDFIPEFSNLRIEEKPVLRLLVDKNGVPLELFKLSDGERGLLAIIFDITRRLAIANPELEDPISEGKAIVLIDEIELHLHPSWQRKALRKLKKVFGGCQFIVTTHSPQVIGQVKAQNVRLLHRDDEGRISSVKVSQSFGMDSNWVLQQIMGTPSRDYDVEQLLLSIYDKIDDNNFPDARDAIEKLESSVGLFPELQEAKSMLDRLEMLLNDEKD